MKWALICREFHTFRPDLVPASSTSGSGPIRQITAGKDLREGMEACERRSHLDLEDRSQLTDDGMWHVPKKRRKVNPLQEDSVIPGPSVSSY